MSRRESRGEGEDQIHNGSPLGMSAETKQDGTMHGAALPPPMQTTQSKEKGTDVQGEDGDGDVTDLTVTGLADWIELTLRWFCGDWEDTKES